MISPSLVDGLLLGFVYGIAAMGLSLIWGVMDVINLSHGPIMALGMFGVYLAFTGLGLAPYLMLPLVAVGGLLLGILIWTQWPLSGVWAVGVLVGVNLLFVGWSMMAAGLAVRGGPVEEGESIAEGSVPQ